jgi:hypothetical protein
LCTDEGELLGKRLTERIQLGYQGLKGLDYTVHCGTPTWQNGRDEQIATLDSLLRRTLSRFCSIAWFVTCS